MPASITYILIIGVALYIIVCQFIEQPVKPSQLSIVVWITLLVLRIAAIAVTYSGLGSGLAPVILATTAMSALFLGSIVAEKASIFWQWMQLDTQSLHPLSSRMVK